MKFLEKIEDAINAVLEKMGDHLGSFIQSLTPEFIFKFKKFLTHLPHTIKEKILHTLPIIKENILGLIHEVKKGLHYVFGKIHSFILFFDRFFACF